MSCRTPRLNLAKVRCGQGCREEGPAQRLEPQTCLVPPLGKDSRSLLPDTHASGFVSVPSHSSESFERSLFSPQIQVVREAKQSPSFRTLEAPPLLVRCSSGSHHCEIRPRCRDGHLSVSFAVSKPSHSGTDAQRDECLRGQGTYLSRKERTHSDWVSRWHLQRQKGYERDSVRSMRGDLAAPRLEREGRRSPQGSCDFGWQEWKRSVWGSPAGRKLGTKFPDLPLLPTPHLLVSPM